MSRKSSTFTIKPLIQEKRITYRIIIDYRIIVAIGNRVVAQYALTCSNQPICINKSTDVGIVISGLEVIELRFRVPGMGKCALERDFDELKNRPSKPQIQPVKEYFSAFEKATSHGLFQSSGTDDRPPMVR